MHELDDVFSESLAFCSCGWVNVHELLADQYLVGLCR